MPPGAVPLVEAIQEGIGRKYLPRYNFGTGADSYTHQALHYFGDNQPLIFTMQFPLSAQLMEEADNTIPAPFAYIRISYDLRALFDQDWVKTRPLLLEYSLVPATEQLDEHWGTVAAWAKDLQSTSPASPPILGTDRTYKSDTYPSMQTLAKRDGDQAYPLPRLLNSKRLTTFETQCKECLNKRTPSTVKPSTTARLSRPQRQGIASAGLPLFCFLLTCTGMFTVAWVFSPANLSASFATIAITCAVLSLYCGISLARKEYITKKSLQRPKAQVLTDSTSPLNSRAVTSTPLSTPSPRADEQQEEFKTPKQTATEIRPS